MQPLRASDPRRIGPYQLQGALDEGGLTRVYSARGDKGEVAIKTLLYLSMCDPETAERFSREVRLQVRLPAHRNLCEVLDWGIWEEKTPYLVYPLLRGETLAMRMARPFEASEVRLLLMQILDGLAAIHGGGIVHRNLVPENLFVCESGVVKILDFGLARDAASKVLTVTGQSFGDAPYCSPEVLFNGKYADARSDLFNVGLLAYHSLSGHLPYEGRTEAEYVTHLMAGDFIPIEQWCPQLAPSVAAWLSRMLALRPDARFASAREALEHLDW